MGDYEFFEVSVGEGIAEITMNHPPLNVLNNPMMAELNAILDAVLASEDLAAVVIGAAGKAFCAGVDVGDHTADKVGDMIELFHGIFRKLASTDALTIAAVNGAALGGGCELACFCDIVLASDRAKLGQPEIMLGVLAPVASVILTERAGRGRAEDICLSGRSLDAEESYRVGLADQVAEDPTAAALDYAREHLLPRSASSLRIALRAVRTGFTQRFRSELAEVERLYLQDLMGTADALEGLNSFLEKRKPAWKNA